VEPVRTAPGWQRHLPLILIAALFVLLSLVYFPIAYQGKVPYSTDITQWQGGAKTIIDYNQKHADTALWTQNMFSGMPAYMISFPNRYPFLGDISRATDKVMNWRIFLLFIGGLGIFLLLRSWKLDPWICFAGAVAFIFSCHWAGLLDAGHNTKFRAIMYVPWVLWAMFNLRKKPGLLGLGFLACTLIVQLRENHPQISYYMYLFMAMYWLWQLIRCIRRKEWKGFSLFTVLLAVGFGLTVLAVMNPYMSTMEYSHYTNRGGATGLEKSYAQGWSFHPLEMVNFVVPHFFGGISPYYWGFMPSTDANHYFGIVVLALGILALFGKKHRRKAIFLWIASAIFTIMSFGSFAPAISDLLLKYLPYFNKFRVPAMILAMVQIIGVLLAALGLDTILDRSEAKDPKFSKFLNRMFWACGALFILWLALGKTIFAGLPFAQSGAAEVSAQVKAERLSMLYKSGVLSMLFLAVSAGVAYLKSLGKIKKTAFLLLISALIFLDLWMVTGKHYQNLQEPDFHTNHFAERDYDIQLAADKDNYRIYAVGQNLFDGSRLSKPDGEWAYRYQTVTGYSAAKLSRYDKFLPLLQGDHRTQKPGEWQRYILGIFDPPKGSEPRETPMPVLSMLGVKYFFHPGSVPQDTLMAYIKPYYTSLDDPNLVIYQNPNALPRAWFADSLRVITPADSILSEMRNELWNPKQVAFVEEKIGGVGKPDSASVTQTKAEMHELEYDVKTDRDAFLVLSEIYYPAGWKATLDGKEIPIYPTNYVLRGLKIPAGEHKLRLVFAPESYNKSVSYSLAGLLLSLLALVGGIAYTYWKKPKAEAGNPEH
jgi:hypothetical protein